MIRFLLTFLIVIATSLLLSGCWDSYEIEERAIILALSIDFVEEGEEINMPEVTHRKGEFPEQGRGTIYKVTAQLAVPGKIMLGPEGGDTTSDETDWLLVTYGYTMKDTLSNLQQELAEKIYLGHIQIIVVSDKIAKKGLNEILDFFRRDYEIRRTAWFMITEGEAQKVLKATPPIQTVPSLYLANTLNQAVKFGKLPKEYLGKVWIDLSDIGVDAMIPLVKPMGDHIMLDGLAYFKDDKMVGKLSPMETGGILAMMGFNPAGYSDVISPGENNGVYLIKPSKRKSNIKLDIIEGKPNISINVDIDGIVVEQVYANDLNEEKLKQIELVATEHVENMLTTVIKKLQQDESDVLGIGARLRAFYPKYWNENVKNDEGWYELYKDLEIQINLNYEIRRVGMEWR